MTPALAEATPDSTGWVASAHVMWQKFTRLLVVNAGYVDSTADVL